MSEQELLPCPFCAGEAYELGYASHKCSACGAKTMNDWNTRPIEDELRAEIERLKTVLTEIRDLALTGLAPDSLNLDTEKKWLRYKVNKIAAMASMELDKGRE